MKSFINLIDLIIPLKTNLPPEFHNRMIFRSRINEQLPDMFSGVFEEKDEKTTFILYQGRGLYKLALMAEKVQLTFHNPLLKTSLEAYAEISQKFMEVLQFTAQHFKVAPAFNTIYLGFQCVNLIQENSIELLKARYFKPAAVSDVLSLEAAFSRIIQRESTDLYVVSRFVSGKNIETQENNILMTRYDLSTVREGDFRLSHIEQCFKLGQELFTKDWGEVH